MNVWRPGLYPYSDGGGGGGQEMTTINGQDSTDRPLTGWMTKQCLRVDAINMNDYNYLTNGNGEIYFLLLLHSFIRSSPGPRPGPGIEIVLLRSVSFHYFRYTSFLFHFFHFFFSFPFLSFHQPFINPSIHLITIVDSECNVGERSRQDVPIIRTNRGGPVSSV